MQEAAEAGHALRAQHLCVFMLGMLALGGNLYALAEPAQAARNLISDPEFINGFIVEAPSAESSAGGRGSVEGTRTTPWASGPPVWHLAQWNSKKSVEAKYKQSSRDLVTWENEAKTISIGRPGSTQEGVESFVNANYENDSQYDTGKLKKAWANFIWRQKFRDTPVGDVPLAHLSQLPFSAQYKLTAARPVPNAGVGHNLIFFLIETTKEPHELAYLGLPMYDNRYPVIRRWTGLDHDKHRLIYQLGFEDGYVQGDPRSGEWVNVNVDLLPKISEMLAHGAGRGALSSADYRDYALTGITLNWEVPGLGEFGSKIRRLSLLAVK